MLRRLPSCSSRLLALVLCRASISLAIAVSGMGSKLWAKGAHVHGQAELYLAVNTPQELIVEWKAPAADIFGFEALGQNKERRQVVEERLQSLKKPQQFLQLPAGKDCRYNVQKIEAFGENLLQFSLTGKASSQKSEKKDHKEPNSHKHHHDEHSDLLVTYQIRCQNPITGQNLSLSIGEAFPRIKTLAVVYLGEKSQKKWEVRQARHELSL
ncbi:MAG: ZrgA family zinc uptake protein [Oligoflexus sp.]